MEGSLARIREWSLANSQQGKKQLRHLPQGNDFSSLEEDPELREEHI